MLICMLCTGNNYRCDQCEREKAWKLAQDDIAKEWKVFKVAQDARYAEWKKVKDACKAFSSRTVRQMLH